MFMNVKEQDIPTLRIVNPGQSKSLKYQYPGDMATLTSSQVVDYLNEFIDGKLSEESLEKKQTDEL
jgi:hypothetical protein